MVLRMNTSTITLPHYAKATLVLLLIALLCLLIYTTNGIIFPAYFSLLLAVVLHPAVIWLIRKKIPNVLAIIIVLFITSIVVIGILYFFIEQISLFASDWPQLKKNLLLYIDNINKWLQINFNVKGKFLEKQAETLGNESGGNMVAGTLLSITDIIASAFLVPIYTFLILYYRKLLMKFLLDVYDAVHSPCILNVVKDSKKVVSSYIVGLGIEMIIVIILNATGLWLVGANYIFLLALMAAILNLIPYIGMIIASVIALVITMSYSTDFATCIGVIIVFNVVQIIDNNFIMPMVVGGKVKVNSIIAILGVFVGNALGGISGMFLSIPTIAIMKVAFDNIEHLKPWGMLLGDDVPVKYLSWKHVRSIWRYKKDIELKNEANTTLV